jgi:hypothetical protein
LTDSRNWRTATNSFELQQEAYSAVDTIAASLFPLSVICSGHPIELDKPHILALTAETGFLLFKEQVPLKFKKALSAVQCKRKTFRLIPLSTPVNFRWTVPLSNSLNVSCSCPLGGD